MSDRYKILGQVSSTSSDAFGLPIYTVPVAAATDVGAVEVAPKATSALIHTLATTLIVCNTNVIGYLAGEITVAILDADSVTTILFKDLSMALREMKIFNIGATLSAGEQIRVSSTLAFSTVTYDWNLMGIEITTGGGPNA